MRVAVYLRISEDRTGEEWGIERQREDVRRVIAARGWTVTAEFIDNDVSATKRKPRPRFNEMMSGVEAGEFDVICAKHMDRLLRRLLELEETLQRCEATDTFILTTHDGVDTSTEGGRLVARILASVAQGEVERKKARQISAGKQAAEQGRWTGGRRPFGYEWNGEIKESEADLLRAAYARVLAGGSINSIANEWNTLGITSTLGNKWSGSTVRQMLEKHRYAGLRTYHGEIVGETQWDPIISEETFSSTMAIITAPGRQFPQTRKHLLTGLIRCGKCEGPVGVTHNPHAIYKCKHCGGVSRSKEPVDKLALKLIKGFLASDDAKSLLIDHSREDLALLRVREKALLDKIDNLAIERAQELLTARQLRIATDHVEVQLKEIRAKMVDNSRDRTLRKLIEGEEKWDDLTLDRQRAVIREVVEFTLLPAGKGRTFKPEHLRYRWLVEEE